jgi:hypothetical protein
MAATEHASTPNDVTGIRPAEVWERGYPVPRFSDRYPSTTLLVAPAPQHVPDLRGMPQRLSPVDTQIRRWGKPPFARRADDRG